MSLSIKISYLRDSNVFYGGDEITGIVEIKGPLNLPNATVKIIFQGIAEVGSGDHRDRHRFFSTVHNFFRGAITLLGDETRTFPFKFVLPTHSERNVGQITDNGAVFAQSAHPIPPSAAMAGNYPYLWTAQVLYNLYADVICAKPKRYLKNSGILTVVPSPTQTLVEWEHAGTVHEAQSKTFNQAISRSLTEAKKRRYSFKRWFSSSIESNPKAVFNFTVRTATTLTAGQGIPIQLTLRYDSSASTLQSIPVIHLVGMVYTLNGVTNTVYRSGPTYQHCQDDEKVFIRQMRFARIPLTDGQALDIGCANTEQGGVRPILFDKAVVTAFKTYNIARWYWARIAIIFHYEGKPLTAEFRCSPINVVFNEGYHQQPATQFISQGQVQIDQGVIGIVNALTNIGIGIATSGLI